MIISILFYEISSCNFIDGGTLASYLGILKYFLKFPNLTKFLTVKRWLKLSPSVTLYYLNVSFLMLVKLTT